MLKQPRWLTSFLTASLCVVGVTLSAAASSTLSPHQSLVAQADAKENSHTLTVTGYGDADAPADKAMVKMLIGTPPNYGPIGPEIKIIKTQDLLDMATILVDAGVAASDIITQPFGSSAPYGSGGFMGEVRFTTRKPSELDKLLKKVKEGVDDAGGPVYQISGIVFLVDDCEALEEKAMQAAVENAKARASRLAKLSGVTLKSVQQIEELTGTPAPTCNALEDVLTTVNSGYSPSSSINSPNQVEIAVSLKLVMGIE